MDEPAALLLIDLVDSAALSAQFGDTAMTAVWAAHDRLARDLLRDWRGREIDKTDGFLLLFKQAPDALGYALAYHAALAALALPGSDAARRLRARAGIHIGPVTLRETPAADVARGAKPLEVDGLIKPVAARVMSTAIGGQTLLTAAARASLGEATEALSCRIVSHGHWRLKGLPEPLELFEAGTQGAPFTPPPDAEKAYRVVQRGEVWLPARELPHSLPAERDAFVGRNAALQELARRYERGARLVSLVGIGGCGKTRLATRFGWAWLGEHPGGTWYCDLAPARTVEGLCSAVAQGLQIPLGGEDALLQLGHAIAARGPCLMILDNFEQLARLAESTLGHWLERAPEARFLVTTREVLGIAGEEALALAPLPLAEAQTLFLRRAAAARHDFNPGAEDQAAIAPLVRLLDGLPLAIELAAARVRTLAPRALLARMSERFKLLASSGGRQDRQATLRATFDWSWDLLSAAEKAALAQLAVFEGGCTLEAAEAAIDLSSVPDAPWTLDVVNSLVDKSFVRSMDDGRFDLLGSVQAYATEHLQTDGRYAGSGPAAWQQALARHGAWFAGLGPRRAIEGACADLDNLAAACRRAVLAGDASQAAAALDGAWAALSLRGPFQAGIDLAAAVCAMPGIPDGAAAHAQAVLGSALLACGQRDQAGPQLELAMSHARAVGDGRCEAAVHISLGELHARRGQGDLARDEHSLALQLARAQGDLLLQCEALNGLGSADLGQGLVQQAQEQWEAALALARRSGDRRWQGSLLGNLGHVHASLGRMDAARAHCEDALLIARELGDRKREGNMLCNLGMLHQLQGRSEAAARTLEEALEVSRVLGHARLECIVLGNLGTVYGASQRMAEAVARYEAALSVARQIGDRRTEGQFLGHLGLAHAGMQAFALARECLQAGATILTAVGDRLSLALLLCACAECEWSAGDAAAALQAQIQAASMAVEVGAGPESELGSSLARLGRLLASAPTLSR